MFLALPKEQFTGTVTAYSVGRAYRICARLHRRHCLYFAVAARLSKNANKRQQHHVHLVGGGVEPDARSRKRSGRREEGCATNVQHQHVALSNPPKSPLWR
jgi:hypothetical protein